MSLRYDGSSRFWPGHKWGAFPSASLGWRFTDEEFLRGITRVVNSGKLRVSYGALGNIAGVGNYEQNEVLDGSNYVVGGSLAKGMINRKMINRALSWESTRVFNVGLDLGFLNNRLNAELDYYDRFTYGMIRPSSLSSMLSGAYDAPRQNIGEMRNVGVELNLVWRDRIGDFSYNVGFNGSYNANKLERWHEYLARGNVFIGMPYQFAYPYVSRVDIIQNWQQIYDAPWQSAGSAPGDQLLEDLNGDGTISGDDRKAMPGLQHVRPVANFGLTGGGAWNGFDFSMLWTASVGRKEYWLNHFNQPNLMAAAQALTETQYYNSWTYDNRDAMIPRLRTGTGGRINDASTYWLDDMSYVRLKNLQLGYTLPERWLSSLGISTVRVYASGENLLTLTKSRWLDPEKALTGSQSQNDAYPMVRTISFGINIVL
jgi:TonB-linked SusC/RagA family outer membrane protein